MTLSIEYGREYRFGIYPYAGQSVSVSETHILSPAVFCVHHHLENHNVADRESVFDWCTETQTIASKSYSDGGNFSSFSSTFWLSVRVAFIGSDSKLSYSQPPQITTFHLTFVLPVLLSIFMSLFHYKLLLCAFLRMQE